MSKDKRRKPYDALFTTAVKVTATNFQVSSQYVYMALNGTSTKGRTDEIRKYFNAKYAVLTQAAASSKFPA